MATQTTLITDADLLAKVEQSPLEEGQKNELKKIIPEMTNEERAELMKLMDTNTQATLTPDPVKLAALNEEYLKKMNTLAKESASTARKEFEKIEQEGVAGDLQTMEKTIATLPENNQKVDMTAKKSRHTGLKMFFIFIILATVAFGAWYSLKII